ncbi:MAG: GNAT family N-acetyltransferase [Geminicoccaceae bacterium]
MRSLQQLFDPERIVWVGPEDPASGCAATAERTLWQSGCRRPITAVRSTGVAAAEHRASSIAALAYGPGLAVVCLPQADLVATLGEITAIGCRAVILIGTGAGASALDAEAMRAVAQAARTLDIRVVGPDRVGVIVPRLGLNAGCAADMPPAGDLAFITQSDSIATSMLAWASAHRIGFSHIVSLGDAADVELGDILDFLTLDLGTRAILMHLQGIADARRFMSAARAAARVKPVIVLKSGRHLGSQGARGRMAGIRLHRDRVYDVAFTRAGVVRVETIEELFAAAGSLGAAALRRGHGLRNGRLAMLSNGHAPAELAADTLLAGGGNLVRPTAQMRREIAQAVGPLASMSSAVDLGLEADAAAYGKALDALLAMPDIDGVLVIHAPSADVDPASVAAAVAASADRRKPRSQQRPVIGAWLGATLEAARPPLDAVAIPAFAAPEPAVRAFLHRVQHERRQFLLRQVPSSLPEGLDRRRETAERLIAATLGSGRLALNEAEAMALLDAYGIRGVATRLAADLAGAARAAAEIGYPVALKVLSHKLPQKSAVGGVALDVAHEESLLRRGSDMLQRIAAAAPEAPVEGLLVQRMERSLFPIELYAGMELDPTFGPVLLVGHAALAEGAGGLAYLQPPLDSTLAHAMLDETDIGRFLARQPEGAVLMAQVVEMLVRLSQLVVDQPAVTRVAIDPLLIGRDRLIVLDAHVELTPVPRGADPGARLAVRPYPRELEQTATMRDGRTLRLRPIRPEDAPALKRLFEALTPEDRRRRLFSSMREISEEFAARLTQIDYDREMVLVALDPDDPAEFWGGARIAADADNRRAEYSVTIRSDKQGLGIGRICFERALAYAQDHGIEEVWGSVLAENDGMLGLAERLGFTRRRDPDTPDVFITSRRLDRQA